MNLYAKAVKDYYHSQSPLYEFNSEVLNDVISSMDEKELKVLDPLVESLDAAEDINVLFVATKIFNRHNDLWSGATKIDDNGDIIISDDSSISELDIEPLTLIDCNRNCIYKIRDVEAQYLPVLPLEAIADLTGEIVKFQQAQLS